MPYELSDETVRAIRVLHEVLRVPARISAPVLWEKHALRVVSSPWTGASHILGSETLGKVTSGHGTADVFDEPTHK